MGASAIAWSRPARRRTLRVETLKQFVFGDVFEQVRACTPPDDKSLVNAIRVYCIARPALLHHGDRQAWTSRTDQGEFGGLGIESPWRTTGQGDPPIDDTPAAKAGVLAGDYIAEIDGQEVTDLTLNDAVEDARPVNTPISSYPAGADKSRRCGVVRDIIRSRRSSSGTRTTSAT
jgi:carboxyl-terminal processing protease